MEMKERVNTYWSKRAQEFSQCRLIDLAGPQRNLWLDLIQKALPDNPENVRALDVGTGAGFYAFLLAELGCKVTAIDYSQAMVDEAVKNAQLLHYNGIEFRQMDAMNLEFENESLTSLSPEMSPGRSRIPKRPMTNGAACSPPEGLS
jgi:ubiquinone/menaquinone biosynthesis C-methylase UbiE